MNNPYRVECYKGFKCLKSRKFTTADKAVNFANDWHDNHDGYDVQIITPSGAIYQTCTNGNMNAASIKG